MLLSSYIVACVFDQEERRTTMKCPNCKKEINESYYCPECGYAIFAHSDQEDEKETVVSEEPVVVEEPTVEQEETKTEEAVEQVDETPEVEAEESVEQVEETPEVEEVKEEKVEDSAQEESVEPIKEEVKESQDESVSLQEKLMQRKWLIAVIIVIVAVCAIGYAVASSEKKNEETIQLAQEVAKDENLSKQGITDYLIKEEGLSSKDAEAIVAEIDVDYVKNAKSLIDQLMEDYLSEKVLMRTLTKEYGFTKTEAKKAIVNADIDFDVICYERGKYLPGVTNRSDLMNQLESEGFTDDQITDTADALFPKKKN